MVSLVEASGPKSARRERTFVGSSCAACEEPLEHTLRGERILSLQCGHVAHEECFWEYIKENHSQDCPTCGSTLGLDMSRGGKLDLDRLNKLISQTLNNVALNDTQSTRAPSIMTNVVRQPESYHSPGMLSNQSYGSPRAFGNATWEPNYQLSSRAGLPQTNSQTFSDTDARRVRSFERYHARNDSSTTGGRSQPTSHPDFDSRPSLSRKHDYDVHSMEMTVGSPRQSARNPVPAPTVTVRSEFPTLSRSSEHQTLTCLVTVEVVDSDWRPDPEDLQSAAPPSTPQLNQLASPKPSVNGQSNSTRIPRAPPDVLRRVTDELYNKVENWHGLDYSRVGRLILYGTMRVGKDGHSWQDLECYLFTEMLICVKARKPLSSPLLVSGEDGSMARCTLKGSILIRKHLKHVEVVPDQNVLTLGLSVSELPLFHLLFEESSELESWRRALVNMEQIASLDGDEELDIFTSDEEEAFARQGQQHAPSVHSSHGAGRSDNTGPTEYTSYSRAEGFANRPSSLHVPVDIVVVVPVSSSMQGLKISLLRDVLRFLLHNLGDSDRMGLVTFGSSGGGVPLVGMTNKSWNGWTKVLDTIKPLGQKSLRADVVEGVSVAMDLLMQRKSSNPLSSILLISDSASSEGESVDFVVSRAEATKISIHSFGLGLTHKPDTLIELSSRTKAIYTYVKDWMMLRECVAGCLGSLQSISHQNARLKLNVPLGCEAKFTKLNGGLHIIKRTSGRDAECSLGDLRFGDKRDILVQLSIPPEHQSSDEATGDAWDTIVSGLEALGGPLEDSEVRTTSIEEMALLQADLSWGDILRQGAVSHLPRPSLLAITMLPASKSKDAAPPIPPHPLIVQRRMELLTSDMLIRALGLVGKNQPDRASALLTETRAILKGLGKGVLPPPLAPPPTSRLPPTPSRDSSSDSSQPTSPTKPKGSSSVAAVVPGVDAPTMTALDAELDAALEWIAHPAVFQRDARKHVLQAVGVVASQRAFTWRSPAEALWAARVPGIRRGVERAREWREEREERVEEESSS